MLVFLDECAACGMLEERTFRDDWTGMDLCPPCLSEVINEVTLSPASEGDNLMLLLVQHGLINDYEDDENEDLTYEYDQEDE